MSIHIIDDEAIITEILSSILSTYSNSILCFKSAEAYLAHMQLKHYDEPRLIITDVIMPGISGLELVEIIRDKQSTSKIIVMSGFYDYSTCKPSTLGVDGTLSKPFQIQALQTMVSDILEQKD